MQRRLPWIKLAALIGVLVCLAGLYGALAALLGISLCVLATLVSESAY